MLCPKDKLEYCDKVNMKVPSTFCIACGGRPENWAKLDVSQWRVENRPPAPEDDGSVVSVVMPARETERPHISKTIDSLCETAKGKIELIVVEDGWHKEFSGATVISFDEIVGQRKAVNEGVKKASGEYIFRLDPHCLMSPDWDVRLKESCKNKTIVTCVFDHLDKDWKPLGRDAGAGYLTGDLTFRYIRHWIPLSQRKIEEETMAFSGGAWMIRKDYYWQLGGHDESLGGHGNVGSEWSLKCWLTGGRVIVRTDTICYHLFRAKLPYPIDPVRRKRAKGQLYKQWVLGEDLRRTKPVEWLLYKFRKWIATRTLVVNEDTIPV